MSPPPFPLCARVLLLAGCFLTVAEATCAQAPPLPIEVQVTKSAIPDYEFDSARLGRYCPACNFGDGNSRLAFTDAEGNVWLGYVDYYTGDFYPPDGHGWLLDTNGAKVTDYGNGPEWMSTAMGSQIVYTKYLPGQPKSDATAGIALARVVNGAWASDFYPNGIGRASPSGTLNDNDSAPRVNYVSSTKDAVYWRSMTQPDVEHEAAISDLTNGNARRWVAGTNKIIFQGHPPDDGGKRKVDQIYLYDTDTGEREQLTTQADGVVGCFMWRAPEFNNEFVFLTMARFRQQMLVYRKLPGVDGTPRWTVIKTITAPSALPYFWSPEPFTHNGRSYIFTQLSPVIDFTDLTKPTHIAITGISPLNLDFRMLTNGSDKPRIRQDPEVFITAQGPFIYYNRIVPQTSTNQPANDGVWRVDTGLGPPKL